MNIFHSVERFLSDEKLINLFQACVYNLLVFVLYVVFVVVVCTPIVYHRHHSMSGYHNNQEYDRNTYHGSTFKTFQNNSHVNGYSHRYSHHRESSAWKYRQYNTINSTSPHDKREKMLIICREVESTTTLP